MKKEKKQIVLNGSLLRPLSVGRGAILHAGGNIYHTSRVVAILEESEDCVRFETQNSHYHLSMSPFPLAAVSPDRKSTRLNSSHTRPSRMPSSA